MVTTLPPDSAPTLEDLEIPANSMQQRTRKLLDATQSGSCWAATAVRDVQADLTISITPRADRHQRRVTPAVAVDELGELDQLLGVRERVVDDEQAVGAHDADQLGPVAGVQRALGVEEDQVEGVVGEAAQRLGGVLGAQLDAVGHAGVGRLSWPGRCARPRSRG